VKQLMSFVRGVQGERITLQLRHLVRELLNFIGETFSPMIRVQKHCPKNIWNVTGDATQLYQVLMNLAINARDAMPNGGTLTIDLENIRLDQQEASVHFGAAPGMYVILHVKDTGSGIPPEIINRIFDPFFTTKEPEKGTGLGLFSVLNIVKSHGGFIDVQSEIGKGTEFRVFLPAEEEQVEEQVDRDRIAAAGHGETILIVDDERNLQDVLRATLESRNFTVLSASDGIEAIKIYEKNKNRINVVLLDMLMPSMNGPSTVPMLRKINPQVKIIGMTGCMVENLTEEMHSLMQELPFLQKPFDSEDVVTLVNDVMRGVQNACTPA
jgi:two-component system cell cycle sensor histidine kinase/response regulator CckA